MITNQKTKWKLLPDEIENIELPGYAKYHLVLTDKTFQRMTKFGKDKDGIVHYASQIIETGISGLDKITQNNYDWKIFQHLKPEIEDENEPQVVMTKHNSKEKVRIHAEHHVLLRLSHKGFAKLKENHARINTFSMAVLARVIIEVFLDLFDKYGNYDEALGKLINGIAGLINGKNEVQAEASFKIFCEVDENDEGNSRLVVFFVVNFKSDSGFCYEFRLRL